MKLRIFYLVLGVLLLVIALTASSVSGQNELWTPSDYATFNAPEIYSNQIYATDTYTIHLPLVTFRHDPSYIYPFGVITYDGVRSGAGLTAAIDVGAYWLTTKLLWAAIEPVQGVYNWDSFDRSALTAQSVGAEMFILFTNNPAWAAELPGGPVYDIHDLVNFVTLMAERYDGDGIDDAPGSPVINYWSFYAEPDNGNLWRAQHHNAGYWGHDGAGYAEMLYHIAPAIHAANPNAKVLIGGVAYDYFEEDGGPFVRTFLTDTLAALNNYPGGARNYIDAVAFHFYPISAHRWPTILDKAAEIRAIMAYHGIADLPLICPEMGYWSSEKWGSSPQIQANRLVQMFTRALSMDMSLLSWYKIYDAAVAGSAEDITPDRTAGLLDIHGNPKPTYYAYKTMTTELNGAHYVRALNIMDIEGYVFRLLDQREITVLWAVNLGAQGYTNITFPYACMRRVEVDGTEYAPILDGDPNWDWDHAVNGQIKLGIHETNQPIYVMPCP